MRILQIILLILICSCSSIAQIHPDIISDTLKKENTINNEKCFILKIDFLNVLNNIIDNGNSETIISGELCFKQSYSLQLNSFIVKESSPAFKRYGCKLGAEFRWYLWDYDYSCLHIGPYCRFENRFVTIHNVSSYSKYKLTIFELGLTGGYQLFLNKHWIIDPSAYAGIADYFGMHDLEPVKIAYNPAETGFEVSVLLSVGYKF